MTTRAIRRCLAAGAAGLLLAAGPSAAQTSPAAAAPPASTEGAGTAQGPAPEKSAPVTDGFAMGAFTVKPGGRIKLDVIRDFKPIGNEDSFDTRTIPVDGSTGTNSNLIAKESRLSLDIRGPVDDRELRMYLEGDFYGTSSAFRLRQAFGRWGGLTAGQTWSTFVDDDNLPRTIDFESPTAFAQIRQAQVRWSQKLVDHLTWDVALEDNKSAIVVPSTVSGKAEFAWPDFVNRLRADVPHGHVSGAVFLGGARFRPASGDPEDTLLWGTAGSVKFSTFGKDTIYSVVTAGEGIGRYRSGTTAVFDTNGELQPVGGWAFMGGYEHFWTDRWSSNAVYSLFDTAEKPYYDASITSGTQYAAVNLLWWFLGDRGWTGVEYLYGDRETFGAGEPHGSAHRVQYAVRFNLP